MIFQQSRLWRADRATVPPISSRWAPVIRVPFPHILRQLYLSSAVRSRVGMFCLVCPCILSNQFFLSWPSLLLPSRVHSIVVYELVLCWMMRPNQESFRRFIFDKKFLAFQQGNPLAVLRIRSFYFRCGKCGGIA